MSITTRLRREQLVRLRTRAQRSGTRYQSYLRELIDSALGESDGPRENGTRLFKFVQSAPPHAAIAVVLASSRSDALAIAERFARENGGSVEWLRAARADEVPLQEGVAAWAEC